MDVRIYNQNISSDFTGNRNHLIKSLIMKYDADICLFQECAPWSCRKGDTAIDKVMAPEYAEAFVDIENVNYTPVYYKKERFEEVETGYVLYAGLNDCDSKGLTWCVLREKTSGKLTALWPLPIFGGKTKKRKMICSALKTQKRPLKPVRKLWKNTACLL